MSTIWLGGLNDLADGPGRPMTMPVFAGQKLVVVGGSSGMGRQAAADVIAVGGSAVIIGRDPAKVGDTVQALAKDGKACGITADLADREQAERVCRSAGSAPPRPGQHHHLPSCPRPPAGSPVPSGTSTAASWPDATKKPAPPVRRPSHPAHGPPHPGYTPAGNAGHNNPGGMSTWWHGTA